MKAPQQCPHARVLADLEGPPLQFEFERSPHTHVLADFKGLLQLGLIYAHDPSALAAFDSQCLPRYAKCAFLRFLVHACCAELDLRSRGILICSI